MDVRCMVSSGSRKIVVFGVVCVCVGVVQLNCDKVQSMAYVKWGCVNKVLVCQKWDYSSGGQ